MEPGTNFRIVAITLLALLALLGGHGSIVLAQQDVPGQAERQQEAAPPPTESPKQDDAGLKKLEATVEELRRTLEERTQQLENQARLLDEQAGRQAADSTQIAAQAGQIEAQLKQIREQASKIDKLDKLTKEQGDKLTELNEIYLSITNRLLELEDQAPVDSVSQVLQERLDRLEGSVEAIPEIPTDVVEAGEFPGSFTIPGTDAALKIGGRVRLSIVQNLNPMLTADRFLTAAIPVTEADASDPNLTQGLSLSARTSRLNFDLRTPTGVGHVRAFIEADFAGTGDSFRLRHAYGQYQRILVGQTWTLFSDQRAAPVGLDFEGINSQVLFRQPQVRWSERIKEVYPVSIAIENPEVDVTGGQGVNEIPDLIGRVRRDLPCGHVQVAAMFRQIRAFEHGNPDVTVGRAGISGSVSGLVSVPWWHDKDNLMFQANIGRGIGRYINDLDAEGGQDGVFEQETGELGILFAVGAYASYHHFWTGGLHSTVTYSFVRVNNLDYQADDSYRKTHRLAANFIVTPINRLDMGVECLWGLRQNKDRQQGEARQIQLSATFQF
jgi:hypothetical protein